jgi:hypothetical protein
VRRGLNQRTEYDFGMAAHDVDHGRATAPERHVHDIDAGHQLEQLAAEMLETADAGRRILQFTRLLFGERDQFLHRVDRQFRIDRKHVGAAAKTGDRDKGFGVIVRQFVEPRIDRVRQRDDEKRIAVRCRLGGDVGADRSASAAAIIDIDLLAQLIAQMTGDQAADHVVAATRRERDDEPYLPVRVFVGGSAGGQCQQHRAGFQEPR